MLALMHITSYPFSEEYGKVFTLSSVAGSIASLIGATVVPKIYNATIDTFPGKHHSYSKLLNESTGTLKKYPPKIQAVCTFFAVLLQLSQVNAVPEN